jgi:hypothetical protein
VPGWSGRQEHAKTGVGRPSAAPPPRQVPWNAAQLYAKTFGKNSAENFAVIDAVTVAISFLEVGPFAGAGHTYVSRSALQQHAAAFALGLALAHSPNAGTRSDSLDLLVAGLGSP